MSPPPQLSSLQLAVMRILWDRGDATVAHVHSALRDERGLAMTTIATVLSRLEKRGVVAHNAQGRHFVYRATVSESEMRRAMVAELVDRVFEGNITGLVGHLLDTSQLSPEELARVRRILNAKEREWEQVSVH